MGNLLSVIRLGSVRKTQASTSANGSSSRASMSANRSSSRPEMSSFNLKRPSIGSSKSRKSSMNKYGYIPDNYSSLEQVTKALRESGLESSNLIIGIDFTKSNEWTGKVSFNNRSLHAIGDTPNPYEKAISLIGKTLAPFDDDNLIPCFGFGDEPTDANAMALSLHHGQRVVLDQVGGFADGVAVKEVGLETFRLCRELIDGVVLVTRDAICASIKDMFEEKRSILEPAGALALAGAEAYCKFYNLKDINVVAITSGANMNFDRLRLVTELANVGRQREAVLATFMPEEPGSFKQFAELIGKMNITEFKYRYESERKQAHVLYSVGVHTKFELQEMVERMESHRLKTIDFTNNDLVKDHLRHLMGGRTDVENEQLCRFVFPERPGALMKFLQALSPLWNISLFHYRAQGGMGANVLVIIADGQVTRSINTSDGELNLQEQKTISSIVEASLYPLVIILVGVGDGPWDDMRKFDDKLPTRGFDNFQFVNFTGIMSKDLSTANKEAAFALAALMEIPIQYTAVTHIGLLGQVTGNAKRIIPRPPPRPRGRIHGPDVNNPASAQDDENKTCPICLTNEKDMAFGCGHMACRECGSQLSRCHICRQQISSRIRLYTG